MLWSIPVIALLTLIEHLIVPEWSLFRLVVLASLICLPSDPLIWQYSRVIWIYFDRYFDPEDDQDEHRRSMPDRRKCRVTHACRNTMEPAIHSDRSPSWPRDLKIAAEHLEPYGRDKAKVRLEALHGGRGRRGRRAS